MPFPDITAEGGRGFPIMQRCTDFFDVWTTPAEGTVVTLGRRRRDAVA
jgi:anti-sigma regulatory factor (Ser/Thr protein kinase)